MPSAAAPSRAAGLGPGFTQNLYIRRWCWTSISSIRAAAGLMVIKRAIRSLVIIAGGLTAACGNRPLPPEEEARRAEVSAEIKSSMEAHLKDKREDALAAATVACRDYVRKRLDEDSRRSRGAFSLSPSRHLTISRRSQPARKKPFNLQAASPHLDLEETICKRTF